MKKIWLLKTKIQQIFEMSLILYIKREIAWEHDRFMVVHPDGDDQTTWNVIEKR